MIGFLIYMTIAFVVFFFCWKKYSYSFLDTSSWVEYTDFWRCVFAPLFWPISIPVIVLWKILNKIYKKFNK